MRACLENMCPLRARRGLVARTLGGAGIEERLSILIRRSGEDAANWLREEIRPPASPLYLEEEASTLDAMIGAREAELTAPSAIARRFGYGTGSSRLA